MPDVINPNTLRTGSEAINSTIFQLLAATPARGGLVVHNKTDSTIFLSAQDSTADNDAYLIDVGEELALGDYRGMIWVRGDGSGRVYYAYTE